MKRIIEPLLKSTAIFLFALALAASAAFLTGNAQAGTWEYNAWTGDADSGITSASPYTVAVNFTGGGGAVTVNGVFFEDSIASGANFSIGGDIYAASGAPNISGDSYTLANAFIYGGNPRTVTLNNLTPGAPYETSFFSYGWEAAPYSRIQTFASGSDSVVLDQDLYGQNNGIRISYTFVADSSGSQVLTITPVGDGTFHMSALANRELPPATILNFGANVAGSSAVIDPVVGGAANIAWTVPFGTVKATLAPTYALSSGTCDQPNGAVPSPNFGAGPVTYTVTDGGTMNIYTVTATVAPASTACDITAFNANLAGSSATITTTSPTAGTVVVHVPYGTTEAAVAALAPSYTLSAFATCNQASDAIPTPALSLTTPVVYSVTAQSGANKDYTVTVVVEGLIKPIAVTAQSYYAPDDRAPVHAIDGSGMTPSGPVTISSTCGTAAPGNMWMSDGTTATWITFDLGNVMTISGFHLWNYNQAPGGRSGRGVKTAGIYTGTSLLADGADYSTQAGANWGTWVQDMTFTQAPEAGTYTGEYYTFAAPVTTRYLQIYVTENFGTYDASTGISEIMFTPLAQILSFGNNVAGSSAVIDQTAKTIAWTVPYGTPVTDLKPSYTLSSGTCDKDNGGPTGYDFSSPVTYTVTDTSTDPDTTNAYTVRVTVDAQLASVTYDLGTEASPTIIKGEPAGFLPWIAKGSLSTGSILRSLAVNATFWSYFPPFAGPAMANNIAAYLDTLPEDPAAGGVLQVGSYWPWNQGMPDNQAFCNYNGRGWANGGGGPVSTVTDTKLAAVWASVLGEVDLSTCQLSVGNYQYEATYSGTMTVVYEGPGNDIVAFGLPGYPGVFTGGNTIALTVPYAIGQGPFAPSFKMSDGATCKVGDNPIVSGVTLIDFTSGPVVFTVTAQDGSTTKDYTVTVTVSGKSAACDITAFGPGAVIDQAARTIVWHALPGTDKSTLAPTYTVSPFATCLPASGSTQDFTSAVHYIVTAQDGTTKDYTVTVEYSALPVWVGLSCWYDAAVGVTVTDGVATAWDDQSGRARNGTAVNTPVLALNQINGLPAVQLRSDSRFNVPGPLFVKEQYVVVRAPDTTWSNYGAVLGRASGRDSNYLLESGTTQFHNNQYPAAVSKNGTVLASPFDVAPINEYMLLKITVALAWDTSEAAYRIGRADGYSCDMDIAEIIGYGSTLSTADETLLGIYLAAKYGLTTEYRPVLGFVPNGNGTFTLTWTSGRLLEATNVMGPWTTNAAPGPTLIVTPVPTVPQQYYRVQAP